MTEQAARRHPHLVRPLIAVLLVAVAALGTAACGDDKKDSGTASGSADITIKDFAYSPSPLKAKVGATITVKNDDGTTHTLTADDDSVDTGNISGGKSGSVKLSKAGTLKYHCNIHGTTMAGTIDVSE
jgi:plastocyanin